MAHAYTLLTFPRKVSGPACASSSSAAASREAHLANMRLPAYVLPMWQDYISTGLPRLEAEVVRKIIA